MEYRLLGRSGLKVSTLTFGTATFGGVGDLAKWGSTDVTNARRLLDICIDAGINTVDTANLYSYGKSEEILGEAMEGRRNQLIVATKLGFPMGKGVNDHGLSRFQIIKECEASLKRLRISHIDLYQMHQWDGLTPLQETLEAFDALIRAGKVRYIGASNFSGWHLMKAMETARVNHFVPIVSQQIYYSLESRDAEYELIPITLDQGLGVLIWSPLAGGLLSGKYRRGKTPEEGGRHLNDWHEPPIYNQEKLYDTIEVLVAIAEARGISAAEVALAWLLGRPGVTSVVFGARTEDQLRKNLRSADLTLTAEERKKLDDISLPTLIYPYWHQRNTAADRLGPADLSLIGPYLDK
ncbi:MULTISPECIES: aldo/keto reductase [unclassified Acidisoma]|uniref:aldo/keto reductase n=1 Tax=unclassified Acidisoma TaxID=2634065 RepID=UPI00131C6593|nr:MULTISPECIES: aldo/keto reductase [unclassified Acidisoma]